MQTARLITYKYITKRSENHFLTRQPDKSRDKKIGIKAKVQLIANYYFTEG